MHYFANSGSVFNWLSPAQCPVPVGPGRWASLKGGRQCVTKGALFSIVIAITGVLCMAYTQPAFAQEKRGVIPQPPRLRTAVPDPANREVPVYPVEYKPGGINPRNFIPAPDTSPLFSGTYRTTHLRTSST